MSRLPSQYSIARIQTGKFQGDSIVYSGKISEAECASHLVHKLPDGLRRSATNIRTVKHSLTLWLNGFTLT